ncbi:YdcF family protein [Alphaproteobacteria bacterium]|nr:YdcF family protein [Alphaproteobacteria bacterium]
MLFSVFKTICIVFISSILTYFLIGLIEYKEKILSNIKYISKKSSNIVILTGGTNRIKDGLKIVNKFEKTSTFNSKILVSGTGKGFTKTSLEKNINFAFDFNLIKCCIELDSISTNTYSNAFETLKWVKKNNISEFILITSNYHMPRAFLEFKYRMPNLKIFTYPITPKKHDVNMWLSSFQTFSLIFSEYCKFLVANFRIAFQKM